ncbi:MAG: EfeM/EfeO family lipoprotein [Gordonia sp. (in: high G+C Gram-positive bacteria)]|uniref:iron uptake system protein EfeO n=1 Tax=Gordonia sp. (in: high G+C Gram-positive bacteria) TaxID=84139 RepID=UPI0039E44696
MRSSLPKAWIAVPALAAVSAAALAGCSSSDDSSNGKVSTVNITMQNNGGSDECAIDQKSVPAGPVTFKVANKSAPGITEVEVQKDQRILGEKENLAPGLDPVQFTVTLDGGDYTVYCPGAKDEKIPFTVTGQAAAAPTGSVQTILADGTKEYGQYVDTQIASMVEAVGTLNSAVQSGDVQAAKDAYAKARPFYERAEAQVEGFVLPGFKADDNAGNLDYLIDMRESTPVDDKVGWKGFHAIERDLWQKNAIDQGTKDYSTELVTNVGKLNDVVKGLDYKPEDLANGASDLLEEVQNGKITGEEEQFSHLDLVDFAGNLEGAQQAFVSLRPGLEKIDPNLVTQIDQQFQAAQATIDSYRDPSALGGYKEYTPELKASDSAKLQAAIAPLHDSLSTLAEKVVQAN